MGNTKTKQPAPQQRSMAMDNYSKKVQSPYRPGTADGKKKKKTTVQFMDEEKSYCRLNTCDLRVKMVLGSHNRRVLSLSENGPRELASRLVLQPLKPRHCPEPSPGRTVVSRKPLVHHMFLIDNIVLTPVELLIISRTLFHLLTDRIDLFIMALQGGAPAQYAMDEGSQGALCCLDNNHTHFILVDDGTHGKYGVEIPLRTKLEKFISEQTMVRGGSAIKIPIVCVVLEGGPGTLDTIYNSMCNNTPCVIVEGSGRVADIIAQVAHFSPSRVTISLVKDKLQNLFQDTYESFTETQIVSWTKKIQDIVRMGSLLTVLREERGHEEGMDVAILQALLKASQSTDRYGQENWDHQLKLAVSWNRPDIAKTQIFTEDWTWKPSDLYPVLLVSLIENKPSFVRLFLELGVSISEFLTWDTLTILYNNLEPSGLIHNKLERQISLEGFSRHQLHTEVQLHHVSRVLQELLGEFTEPFYSESRRVQNMTTITIKIPRKVGSWKMRPQRHLEHPVRDLLIWCIVQNRAELADIIWSQSNDCIAAALACSKILKQLSKEEENTENMEDMKKLADMYEERAVGVFSECCSNDEKRAELLLTRVSPTWGKTTTLELAQESQGRIFMSHGGVQMFLTRTWWGFLSVDNGFINILLCMLFFPLIYSGLITYRNDIVKSKSYPDQYGTRSPTGSKSHPEKSKRKRLFKSPPPYSCAWKFLMFFTAPIVKFYGNVGSYLGFLWLFAYVIMMDFQTFPSWREYLLYVWVFSIFCEELRQLLYDPDKLGFVVKSVQYISEFWNRVDSSALILFAVGLICRLVHTNTVYLGRVFLSLDFMIFCIRLMHIFSVSKVLGPKIIILRRMVKDIFFFLFLLAIWIISYGVAKQAILTTNETRLDWIFRNVVYGSYLTLFGQIPSEVDRTLQIRLLPHSLQKVLTNDKVSNVFLTLRHIANQTLLFKYMESQMDTDADKAKKTILCCDSIVTSMLRLLKVEKGNERNHIEGRLAVLEEQMAQSSRYLSWIISALTEKGFNSKTRILAHTSSLDSEDKANISSVNERNCLYHVNARILQYPESKIIRYPVPDEMVPWEVDFATYDPPFYIAHREDRGSYDPHSEAQTKRAYNALDGLLDLQSSCGTYVVQDGLPLNPMGRTGLRGVGSLRWFGPNHSLHPVLTRWCAGPSGSLEKKMLHKKLEVLVVKRFENELWALPGGTLGPGELIPTKLQAILKPSYLTEFQRHLEKASEVFRGYLDDPRNTDNSWIETVALNIHLGTKEDVDNFIMNLNESDFSLSVRWQLLDRKIPLYANEKDILQRAAEQLDAHY
ncbi:transient receptor potential cation channel subfamily M member 2 [Bombina bombina]|uniref:transient receptor potential cation channel subfamily M member 2 n=1 Tax=Bombina bombina TaxID=8345 RepID=UPI00235ACFF1|nr:transient receptor potential cation channel subfamily M member 2 [Bombina bombina]